MVNEAVLQMPLSRWKLNSYKDSMRARELEVGWIRRSAY